MLKNIRLEMSWKVKNSTIIQKIPHFWWKHKLHSHIHNSQPLILINNNQHDAQFLLYIFIWIPYIFRATLCSSSEESIVSIQHLMYVTLCRWPSGMQVGTATLLRLISLTTNESDGRCVHIPEPIITITIYKPAQPNPIACWFWDQK